jgi:hypothetical protein
MYYSLIIPRRNIMNTKLTTKLDTMLTTLDTTILRVRKALLESEIIIKQNNLGE